MSEVEIAEIKKLRQELERSRIIVDMIRRREKLFQRLVHTQKAAFEKELSMYENKTHCSVLSRNLQTMNAKCTRNSRSRLTSSSRTVRSCRTTTLSANGRRRVTATHQISHSEGIRAAAQNYVKTPLTLYPVPQQGIAWANVIPIQLRVGLIAYFNQQNHP